MNILIIWSIFGLFYCAVAHEHNDKNVKRTHHERRHHHRHVRHHISETSPVPTAINLTDYEGLNLLYNTDENLLGFGNFTSNLAAMATVKEQRTFVAIVNSKSGTLMRFEKLEEVSLSQNEEFKGKMSDILKMIEQKYGFDFQLPDKTPNVQPESEEALSLWSDVYSSLVNEKKEDKHRSLQFARNLLKKMNDIYCGPLNGLFKGQGPRPLKQSLNRFMTITSGLLTLFSKAPGGLKGILGNNITFDFDSLYNAKNGAQVFVYILRQVGEKMNLATLWPRLLNNVSELLRVIQQLGGGESRNAVDETFAVTAHIWSALTLRLPLTSLISYLFKSTFRETWSNTDNADLSKVWMDLKSIIDNQSKKYDNLGLLKPFVIFTTNITANGLIQRDVNVSALVEKWKRRDLRGALKVIAVVTLKLVGPEKYGRLLFNGFMAFLNSTSNPEALRRLIPGISTNDFGTQGNTLLESISNRYNIDRLLKNNTGNANEILTKVPVFNEFAKIYKESSGSAFNYSRILGGSTLKEYLTRFVVSPTRWTFQGFSRIWQQTFNILKQTLWSPIKLFIPGARNASDVLPISSIPSIPSLPSIPSFPPVQSLLPIPTLPGNILPIGDKDDDCKKCADKKSTRMETEPTTETGTVTDTLLKSTTGAPKILPAEITGTSAQNRHLHRANHHTAKIHNRPDNSNAKHHEKKKAHHHKRKHEKKNKKENGHHDSGHQVNSH